MINHYPLRNFYGAIREVMPIARLLLENGIDPMRVEFTEDLLPAKEPQNLTDAQCNDVIRWANLHYIVGIAVGLLLDPAAIGGPAARDRRRTKGGVRPRASAKASR